jgi:hypothetical protein
MKIPYIMLPKMKINPRCVNGILERFPKQIVSGYLGAGSALRDGNYVTDFQITIVTGSANYEICTTKSSPARCRRYARY